MLRRRFVLALLAAGCGLVLWPWRVLARDRRAAFSATRLQKAMDAWLDGQDAVPSEHIRIGVEPLVEDGAVVPIKIHTSLEGVQDIAIFVEKNPNPLIASFSLDSRCKGFIATRIKIGEPSNVVAVVTTANGAYRQDTFVEVVEGGCA